MKSITKPLQMWNPIKRLRECRAAEKKLNDLGLQGGIVDAADQAIELILAQQDLMVTNSQALGATKKALDGISDAGMELCNSEDTTVTYFIPYSFEYSQYQNGGRRGSGKGMGTVHVQGGITSYDKVMGVAEFVKSNYLDKSFCNPSVILSGIFEINRCKTPKTEAVVVPNKQPESVSQSHSGPQ